MLFEVMLLIALWVWVKSKSGTNEVMAMVPRRTSKCFGRLRRRAVSGVHVVRRKCADFWQNVAFEIRLRNQAPNTADHRNARAQDLDDRDGDMIGSVSNAESGSKRRNRRKKHGADRREKIKDDSPDLEKALPDRCDVVGIDSDRAAPPLSPSVNVDIETPIESRSDLFLSVEQRQSERADSGITPSRSSLSPPSASTVKVTAATTVSAQNESATKSPNDDPQRHESARTYSNAEVRPSAERECSAEVVVNAEEMVISTPPPPRAAATGSRSKTVETTSSAATNQKEAKSATATNQKRSSPGGGGRKKRNRQNRRQRKERALLKSQKEAAAKTAKSASKRAVSRPANVGVDAPERGSEDVSMTSASKKQEQREPAKAARTSARDGNGTVDRKPKVSTSSKPKVKPRKPPLRATTSNSPQFRSQIDQFWEDSKGKALSTKTRPRVHSDPPPPLGVHAAHRIRGHDGKVPKESPPRSTTKGTGRRGTSSKLTKTRTPASPRSVTTSHSSTTNASLTPLPSLSSSISPGTALSIGGSGGRQSQPPPGMPNPRHLVTSRPAVTVTSPNPSNHSNPSNANRDGNVWSNTKSVPSSGQDPRTLTGPQREHPMESKAVSSTSSSSSSSSSSSATVTATMSNEAELIIPRNAVESAPKWTASSGSKRGHRKQHRVQKVLRRADPMGSNVLKSFNYTRSSAQSRRAVEVEVEREAVVRAEKPPAIQVESDRDRDRERDREGDRQRDREQKEREKKRERERVGDGVESAKSGPKAIDIFKEDQSGGVMADDLMISKIWADHPLRDSDDAQPRQSRSPSPSPTLPRPTTTDKEVETEKLTKGRPLTLSEQKSILKLNRNAAAFVPRHLKHRYDSGGQLREASPKKVHSRGSVVDSGRNHNHSHSHSHSQRHSHSVASRPRSSSNASTVSNVSSRPHRRRVLETPFAQNRGPTISSLYGPPGPYSTVHRGPRLMRSENQNQHQNLSQNHAQSRGQRQSHNPWRYHLPGGILSSPPNVGHSGMVHGGGPRNGGHSKVRPPRSVATNGDGVGDRVYRQMLEEYPANYSMADGEGERVSARRESQNAVGSPNGFAVDLSTLGYNRSPSRPQFDDALPTQFAPKTDMEFSIEHSLNELLQNEDELLAQDLFPEPSSLRPKRKKRKKKKADTVSPRLSELF